MQQPGADTNLWRATAGQALDAPPLAADVTADLTIVGGGFTGCSAALHAAERGAQVRLLEAETLGHGGSGRNVGLVNAGLWLPPAQIEAKLGQASAERLNTALGGAPDLVFSLIEQHAIACEATRAGTLHCAHSPAGLKDLKSRYQQLKARGAPVSLLSAKQAAARIGTKAFHGALHDARAGTIQPLAYCRGLGRAAQRAGALLHETSPVLSVQRDGTDWLVRTASGSVRSRALLLASNAYLRVIPGLPQPALVPVHYFQMATRPLPPQLLQTILPGGEGCWDTATVMSSCRRDAAGRVIIGGIGALDHSGAAVHRAWAKRKLTALFPQLSGQVLEHAWFGRIAMTSDHIPKILRLGPQALCIFGYSGRGIGPGTCFGKAAAEALIDGNEDALPVTPIERHREAFTALRQGFYELGATLYHVGNSVLPGRR